MKFRLLLSMLLATAVAFGQSPADALAKSSQLVMQKKYNSAFAELQAADPLNKNADIVMAKEDILLRYFVTSIMHKMFALKDLKQGEDIRQYRGKPGSNQMYVFPVDSILKNLIQTDTSNYKLNKALGDYYYDVFLHYGDNWSEKTPTLFKYIEYNLSRAAAHKAGDYMTYYELGYIELLQKKYADADNYLLKSIALNQAYANSFYNLAYSYLIQNDPKDALKYALKSINLYADSSYKGDAARMTGEIYSELGDMKNETSYYEMSNKTDSGNYNTLKALLGVYVETNNPQRTGTLNHFYLLAPDNPTIYNDLSDIYGRNQDELIDFYESKMPVYQNDKKIYGLLNFYLAQLYLGKNNKEKAKDCLKKAKEALSAVLPADNAVFGAIDSLLNKTE